MMQGKVCVVTGASSGIGKETALQLAALGATVIVVGRDPQTTTAVVQEIERDGQGEAQLVLTDLSSQQSVHRLADELRQRFPRIDVLINNAGTSRTSLLKTVDGLEQTFAVNVLAPFLLTHLSLDTLKASAPSRVINVVSSQQGPVDLSNLNAEQGFSGLKAYNQSKTAEIMITYEFAKRLANTGVTVNCVSPGFVKTNLAREVGGWMKLFLTLMRPIQTTPQKGAETSVYAATAPELANVSGKYFEDNREKASSKHSYDAATAQELWHICERLTHLDQVAALA
jgi:NAD(P)-dependent dehydrogenase (short-subunit alcohol dehydrogenase family)